MAQYARPTSVIQAPGWSGSHLDVDEAVANDADYMESPPNPQSTEPFEFALTDIADPLVHTGHIARIRVGKNAAGGATLNLSWELRQGATTIASGSKNDVGATPEDLVINVLEAEAANITDYSDLRLYGYFEQV